ncbi:MAG: tetratricopeptide repeat protein, partial [Planctomycetota bacterium]
KGAVVKFPPTGGGYIKAGKDGAGGAKGIAWTGSRVGSFVKGATNDYTVLAPQVGGGCVCREARFDLDGWGRLYIPNGLGYYVKMVDNAGNEITRFGYYANGDSRGPESAVPDPAIPLGWPFSVSAAQVNKKRIYVADTMNRRVVRVELEFAAEETCAVGGGGSAAVPAALPAAKSAAPKAPGVSDKSDRSDGSDAPKPRAVRNPQSEIRSPERVCASWFAMAGNYRKAGMTDGARRYLNRIIEKYPDSEWARRARAELGRL